jgi:hypothetical protein
LNLYGFAIPLITLKLKKLALVPGAPAESCLQAVRRGYSGKAAETGRHAAGIWLFHP